MAKADRLRRLQMGEARHDRLGLFLGAIHERLLQRRQRAVSHVHRVPHPEPEIGRDLVIARTRRMQASRHRPDYLRQTRFHVHMNVFKIKVFGDTAGLKFLSDLVQAIGDLRRIRCLDNPLLRQHRDMGQARTNIMSP